MNNNNLRKPVVFITGASRGIGQALVEKFQAENWLVAACASQSPPVADLGLICDVSDAAQVRTAIAEIIQKLGRLDAVINNAGIAGTNLLDSDASDVLWHRIIDVNLHGTYYVCKYALAHLPNQSGRIVNISSVLGLIGTGDATAYSAAKHAVVGFTKALAKYVAPRQITVNSICPSWVRTEMMAQRMKEMGASEKDLARAMPLGKIIEPQEVADFAYYLVAAPGAVNISGQALTMDGGALVTA